VGDKTNVAARLEEVARRLRMARGGQGGLGI
jgi:class 3 adenylate cyclase